MQNHSKLHFAQSDAKCIWKKVDFVLQDCTSGSETSNLVESYVLHPPTHRPTYNKKQNKCKKACASIQTNAKTKLQRKNAKVQTSNEAFAAAFVIAVLLYMELFWG